MMFQEIVFALEKFWSRRGCLIFQPYDLEKGRLIFRHKDERPSTGAPRGGPPRGGQFRRR